MRLLCTARVLAVVVLVVMVVMVVVVVGGAHADAGGSVRMGDLLEVDGKLWEVRPRGGRLCAVSTRVVACVACMCR